VELHLSSLVLARQHSKLARWDSAHVMPNIRLSAKRRFSIELETGTSVWRDLGSACWRIMLTSESTDPSVDAWCRCRTAGNSDWLADSISALCQHRTADSTETQRVPADRWRSLADRLLRTRNTSQRQTAYAHSPTLQRSDSYSHRTDTAAARGLRHVVCVVPFSDICARRFP